MPLDRLSEQDRSRLAEIIRGPAVPPPAPPDPPRRHWFGELREAANQFLRRPRKVWTAMDAKRHLAGHGREWAAGVAAGAACLLLVAIGAGLARRAAPPAQLQVQERQGQLHLHWDAGSDLVRHARSAKLFITDGSERLVVTIGAARLRRGTVSYARQSERVEFRLAIAEPDGNEVEQRAVFLGLPIEREESQFVVAAPPPAEVIEPPAAEPRETVGHRSRRKPLAQTGTRLPFTCSTGDTFRKTDAPSGWDTFTCRGNNVWGISRSSLEERPAHRPNANATTLTAEPPSASTT